jgi:hypothetical protein
MKEFITTTAWLPAGAALTENSRRPEQGGSLRHPGQIKRRHRYPEVAATRSGRGELVDR